ncbi:retrovirus-related pol polyprotein from transposon TNT 1-94 [Tanacetum coccineum]
MFQAKERKEHLDVVKSLMACKPKPGASIYAFVLEMKGYFDRLESLNIVFDTELSINIILSGLPADYYQFVLSYQMNRKETSIMELHSILQTIKQWIKKSDVLSTSAAHVLTVGHNAKKRKTSHSNWKGKATQGKSDRGSKRKVKSEIASTSDPKEAMCFYCNTKGHWKCSCPKYLKDLKDGKVEKGVHSAVEAAEKNSTVAAHEQAETIHNMTAENRLYFLAEKEAIFLILTGYNKGNQLNVTRNVKTNLFWEFGKFTSRDGESMESYYSRFYINLMECVDKEQLASFTHNARMNVSNFLQQLKTRMVRFGTSCQAGTENSQRSHITSYLTFEAVFQKKLMISVLERISQKCKSISHFLRLLIPNSDKNSYEHLYLHRSGMQHLTSNLLPHDSESTRNKGKEIANQLLLNPESVYEEDSLIPNKLGGIGYASRTWTLLLRVWESKGFGHDAQGCRKPKGLKTKVSQGEDDDVQQAEQGFHFIYMAKIQEVSPAESSSTDTPLEQVQNHDENDVFANVRRHSEQPESINDTYVLEKDDSNVIPDSSNICTNDNQVDQNATESVDERAALANLIANLTLDNEENKTFLKQLKKANASLTQELKECKTNLDESSRALGEATSSRDSSLIALQTKQTELEKYTALNDLTSEYKILQTKLNDTLGLLALKDIDIKEGLKTKTYEISVVNQKHDELVKKSLLTRSQFEDHSYVSTKCATYHGRSTFANPKYLKKAQSDKPRLYEIPYDTSDPANRFCPDGEDTVTLEKESRSKLDKDKVKPYNYTYQNSLYETFKPPSKAYLDTVGNAPKEVWKTMWKKNVCLDKNKHC